MEHQKKLNLLNEPNDSKFMTRKWSIANNQSNANYHVANDIIYNTEVLKFELCDCNDAYILVTGDIAVIAHQATHEAFTNCAPFLKCIIKIDETTINDTENLDLVMPMYNLAEYSSIYSEATGSLWFCSSNETTNFNADIANNSNFKSFKYEPKLL